MSASLSVDKVREVWQTARAQLELELSSVTYNTWILSNPVVEIVDRDNEANAIIVSPTGFHSTNLKNKLGNHIQKVLSGVMGKPVTITYQVGDPLARQSFAPQTNSHARQPQISPATNSPSPRVEDLFSTANMESAGKNKALVRAKTVGLRTDYTFETFAVSSSNEMAHAASTAVSKNPGQAYNPLFLYGGVGVGKTHLMHAIGHNILEQNPTARIIYSTGEEFTNQIVGAIQNKKTINFKDRYRNTDVLLLDDVQFIAGKNSVQEEFFHTFNALTKNLKQIVLTSDRPPHEISLLESRLRSRFEAGLMIDIGQPSFELRTAILLIKAKALNLPIEIEMAKNIAARVDSARKIEGILNSIRSAVELRGKEISDDLIEQILTAEADQKRPQISAQIKDVIKTVADHYRLKQELIKGKSRKQDLTFARHVAMYVCKEDLDESYAEIGRWFSNRDHTSVLHAYHKINEQLEESPTLQLEISAIRMSLAGLR